MSLHEFEASNVASPFVAQPSFWDLCDAFLLAFLFCQLLDRSLCSSVRLWGHQSAAAGNISNALPLGASYQQITTSTHEPMGTFYLLNSSEKKNLHGQETSTSLCLTVNIMSNMSCESKTWVIVCISRKRRSCHSILFTGLGTMQSVALSTLKNNVSCDWTGVDTLKSL